MTNDPRICPECGLPDPGGCSCSPGWNAALAVTGGDAAAAELVMAAAIPARPRLSSNQSRALQTIVDRAAAGQTTRTSGYPDHAAGRVSGITAMSLERHGLVETISPAPTGHYVNPTDAGRAEYARRWPDGPAAAPLPSPTPDPGWTELTVTTTSEIRGYAWLIDGDDNLWLLVGADPAGTGMAVYGQARKITRRLSHSLLRALAIEDAHRGINTRGPLVIVSEPAADSRAATR
jgi:hypothetical protein